MDLSEELSESLENWTDFDETEFIIMQKLGLIPDGSWEEVVLKGGRKYIFWSNNEIGNSLHSFMMSLVRVGVLEYKDDTLEFRWNKEFNPNTKEW